MDEQARGEQPRDELSRDTANFAFTRGPSGDVYTLDDLEAFAAHARRTGVPGDMPVRAKVKGRRKRLVELTVGKQVRPEHRGHGSPVPVAQDSALGPVRVVPVDAAVADLTQADVRAAR